MNEKIRTLDQPKSKKKKDSKDPKKDQEKTIEKQELSHSSQKEQTEKLRIKSRRTYTDKRVPQK